MTIDDLIEKFNEKHNNKYNYDLVEYVNNRTKIKIICPKHGIFEQIPENHKKQGCPKCAKNKLLTKEDFIKKSQEIHSNKYDYSLVEYVNNHTKVKIICPQHGIFIQTPYKHMNRKQGCSICNGGVKSNTKIFINKSKDVHGEKYDYSFVNYINNMTKVEIFCKTHGIFEQIPNNHTSKKYGCPYCNESKGEKEICKMLDNSNIKYIRQYKFKDCKYILTLPFDFYIPDLNLCIEFDGEQHFRIFEKWGGEEKFLDIKRNDEIKNQFCKDNNINLLRIKYNENIKNSLSNLI